MSNSARRHHRVAKKEVEFSHERGVFIPEKYATHVSAFLIVMFFVVFFKGMMIGNWLTQKED